MELKKFNRISTIVATAVFAIAAYTYLATIEPTVSFWDCGEFIASSYKLEVGHPPGNPVFQLIARFFTLFGDKNHAAVLVNAMSALCSALTILFLYLTIVHLARRIYEKRGLLGEGYTEISIGKAITLLATGVTGALVYCWSDTFWFSAVEGEVYAMSSLITAVVVWAMLKWEEQADSPYANRWIIFIALLMGLSVGVHLLNLLAIPAIGLIYYFRKSKVTTWGAIEVFVVSCLLLAFVLWGLIPYIPKISAYVDILFVNHLRFPVNSGAAFFMLLIIVACFVGVYVTYETKEVLWNTIFLSLAMFVIGYSVFAVVVIRSAQNTPTNEYQPDNPFTLVRYLGREQYGTTPLIYGASFNTPVTDIKTTSYHDLVNGKYERLVGPAEPIYESDKMFFPRMWSSSDSNYKNFYQMYTHGKGVGEYNIPTMSANLRYFFDYQLGFMYFRYFLWNFVGRQNDLQPNVPGDIYRGNWESGIGVIDKVHLGDQSEGPDYIVHSRAKNHFYFLPLIIGLIGLFYQWSKDKRNFLVVFLLFFLTGVAIVVYLNQPPYQPRERDYAYAGSFYFFAIWCGFAVMWLQEVFEKIVARNREQESDVKAISSDVVVKGGAPVESKEEGNKALISAVIAAVLCLLVPIQMVSQTWDDHDRSGRYTCHDMAYNYLSGLQKNAMLVTHGDNDTFPLWYIQEVEGVRTDVRVMNTSLLGTGWYINQLRCKQYDSDPVQFTIPPEMYTYGTNEFVPVLDILKNPVEGREIMNAFKAPELKVKLNDGEYHSFIAGRKFLIPVNKENVIKYGIVSPDDYDKIEDTLLLEIPENVSSVSKTDLMMLDLISHYNWDRPLYLLQRGGDINIGIKDYLQYEGFVYKFVPIRSKTGRENNNTDQVDVDVLYNNLMNVYRLESFADDVNIDYQNLFTFSSLFKIRDIMVKTAKLLSDKGETEKAIEILDKMQLVMPEKNFPLNNSLISSDNDLAVIDAVSIYLLAGEEDKGLDLGNRFLKATDDHIALFSSPYHGNFMGWDYLRNNIYYLYLLADAYRGGGAVAEAAEVEELADNLIRALDRSAGDEDGLEEE